MTAIATKKAAIDDLAVNDLAAGSCASQNNNTSDRNVIAVSISSAEFFVFERTADVVIVRVRGEVDICSAESLRDFVCTLGDDGIDVVIDLSQVQFFGTAGLAAFTGMERVTRLNGSNWAIVGGRPVRRMLRAVGQEDLFPCFDAPDAAITDLRERRALGARSC
ncbi:MAG: STAS domain-containing protein [Rhodococcus sp.]|nr:STAS domain-containing protein [Rhodococcus sp. (in: high G+C Gram-positive bacteria)]